ncbi:MAG TPA: diguanylate cyclase [Dissulfurispiraceae bacterium]|nr:diguanylate cyclase [Dissulfurispiraceae bacterium]
MNMLGPGKGKEKFQANDGHIVESALQRERRARQHAEEELRNIFDLSIDMVCIFDFRNARFLKVNPAFERVLGFSEDEILSLTCFDLIHPDDIAATKTMLSEKLSKGIPALNFVNRYRHKDGSYRWLEWNSQPQPEQGITYAVARDISKRKKMEVSLAMSEVSLRAFLEALREAAYIIDVDGIIIEHNSLLAERADRKGQDLRGRKIFDLLSADDAGRWRNRIADVLKTGKGAYLDEAHGDRFAHIAMYPIRDERAEIIKLAVLGQDITWLRRAEEVLLLNEERLESLLTLSQMRSAGEAEIREHAVEEAVSLTRSKFGFLHMVDEERGTIEPGVWSQDVQLECTAGQSMHQKLSEAGLWAEPCRTRRAAIFNDFREALRGRTMPDRHLAIHRLLSVPVFEGERIVAVAGVANKMDPYDEGDAAQLGLYMYTMWSIVKQSHADEVLKRYSVEDPLTGLANRRHFNETFELEWKRCVREQHPLAIVFVDIDFFKAYNDRHGHQAGDVCLRRVADGLKVVVQRPGDLVARYGGEEFVAILPNTELAGAIKIGETMRERIIALNLPHGDSQISPVVTISVGVASGLPSREVPDNATQFLEAADKALYRAKNDGRNRVRWIVVE